MNLKRNLGEEEFVEIYMDSVLDFMGIRKNASLQELERYVDFIFQKKGIPKEITCFLRHSFHWTLFNNPSQSPFLYIQPSLRGEKYVRIESKVNFGFNKCGLVNHFFREYGDYFLVRFEQAFNNFHS